MATPPVKWYQGYEWSALIKEIDRQFVYPNTTVEKFHEMARELNIEEPLKTQEECDKITSAICKKIVGLVRDYLQTEEAASYFKTARLYQPAGVCFDSVLSATEQMIKNLGYDNLPSKQTGWCVIS